MTDGGPVLWQGRPYGGIIVSGARVGGIVVGLGWIGFGLLLLLGTRTPGATLAPGVSELEVSVLGTVVLGAGGYLCFGQFVIDMVRRRSLRYVLTPAEAVISRTWPSVGEERIDIRRVAETQLQRHRDGYGTILFGPEPPRAQAGSPFTFGPGVASFERIAEAERVYAMIVEAAETADP